MELKTIGTSVVTKGQLLTLFVNDDRMSGSHYFNLLYVKEGFDLSQQMAAFYQQLPSEQRTYPSEKQTEQFYLYLLRQGLVERPKSDVIHLGTVGRVPTRILDEYKHSLNPDEFILEKINTGIAFQSATFVNHQGYRFMLLGPSGSLSEVVVEICIDAQLIGSVRLGIVFDRTLDAVLTEEDRQAMARVIGNMIQEIQHFPTLTVGKVNISLTDPVT